MKNNPGTYFFYSLLIIIFVSTGSSAAIRRMMGPSVALTWSSSYLEIDSGSVSVQEDPSWSYSTGVGWFIDYLITPYVSIRTNLLMCPGILNKRPGEFNDAKGQMRHNELGFLLLRHLNGGEFSPWFGAGPSLQVSTFDDVNSYILFLYLSVGLDYEISEDVYFCPEMAIGIGSGIVSSDENSNVVIDVPSGKSFSSSGIVTYIKLGVGKAF